MEELQIFQFLSNTVVNATNAFIVPASSNLIENLKPFVLSGVTLYLFIYGVLVMMGTIHQPVRDFLIMALKISVVTSFALSVGTYGKYVIGGFTGLESALLNSLMPDTGGATTYAIFDEMAGKAGEIVARCFDNASDAGMMGFGAALMWMSTGLLVLIGTAAVLLVGFSQIVLAKLALAIMLAIGPFFIVLLLWPATAKFFSGWFTIVINYVLLAVIVTIIMSFALAILGSVLDTAELDGEGFVSVVWVQFEMVIMCGFLFFVIRQAGNMAAALGGGLSLVEISIKDILAPARAINPQSTRYDQQTGRMETRSSIGHVAKGNTTLNPSHRSAIKAQNQTVHNSFRNWGAASGGEVKSN